MGEMVAVVRLSDSLAFGYALASLMDRRFGGILGVYGVSSEENSLTKDDVGGGGETLSTIRFLTGVSLPAK